MDKLDEDEGAAPLLAAGAGGAAADGARPTKLYSPFACFAFTVNVRLVLPSHAARPAAHVRVRASAQYIIGVGVLGVPKAFFDAGWALSLLILLAVTVVSYMSMVWLLEVGARIPVDGVVVAPLTSAVPIGDGPDRGADAAGGGAHGAADRRAQRRRRSARGSGRLVWGSRRFGR